MLYYDRRRFGKASQSSHATVQLILLLCATTLLAGCMGSVALHNDTVSYSDDYAKDTTEQLLNNLARLAHTDPPYFVQLGQITAQHTYNGTAGFGDQAGAHNHYGASMGLNMTEQPTFQFVPITGTNFMNAISVPISSKLFLTFFDQGKPADILARVMLDSVIVADHEPDENSPLVYHLLRNDPLDPSYPDFLLFCIQLRDKQLHDSDYVEVPRGKRIFHVDGVKITDITGAASNGADVEPAITNVSEVTNTFTGSNVVTLMNVLDPLTSTNFTSTNDVVSSVDQALLVKSRDIALLEQYDTGYGTNYASNAFRYSFERDQERKDGRITDLEKQLPGRVTVQTFYSVQGPPPTSEDLTAPTGNPPLKKWWVALKLRTFMSVMSATAKEEERFNEAYRRKIFGDQGSTLEMGSNGFAQYQDPSSTSTNRYLVQPILRLSSESAEGLASAFGSASVANGCKYRELASVDYGGKRYSLGDVMDSSGLPLVNYLRDAYDYKYCEPGARTAAKSQGRQVKSLLSSNQEVFALLSDLYSDISIDAKNLPVQQLIQVQ